MQAAVRLSRERNRSAVGRDMLGNAEEIYSVNMNAEINVLSGGSTLLAELLQVQAERGADRACCRCGRLGAGCSHSAARQQRRSALS